MAYTYSPTESRTDHAPVAGYMREAVGLFLSGHDLQEAIRSLEGAAFPRQDISIMGTRGELENVFGSKTVDPHIAMDNADTPRAAPARPEEKNIGMSAMVSVPAYVGAIALAFSAAAVWFPATIDAAIIGGLGGGTLGAIMAKIFGDTDTRHYQEQIEKGGLLLWVRTPDREREEIAVEIMRRHQGREVHVHDIV